MENYFHSVTLDKDLCKGCTNCLKRCPTEAIRVRNGKAKIIKERCIDCGECIRVCPYHAKKAVTDDFDMIFNYPYKVALPAPTLYGQFSKIDDINTILAGLKLLGFDEVFEVAGAAEIVTRETIKLLREGKLKKPVINSACPAVVRLIRVRFPNLIDHILPVLSPMDIAAKTARKTISERTGMDPDQIGIFFLSPCAAKMTSVKDPLGLEKSDVDGIISMTEIVSQLAPIIHKITPEEQLTHAGALGISWARSGGESDGLGLENSIAVDGIHNVIKVLEDVEDEKLENIDFVECLSCTGGCVGGPIAVENTFVAKAKIRQLTQKYTSSDIVNVSAGDLYFEEEIEYRPVLNLGENMRESLIRMEQIEKLYEEMPRLDCGSCGAPSCIALAEDIVKGYAKESDCIFKLKERLKYLAKEMNQLDD